MCIKHIFVYSWVGSTSPTVYSGLWVLHLGTVGTINVALGVPRGKGGNAVRFWVGGRADQAWEGVRSVQVSSAVSYPSSKDRESYTFPDLFPWNSWPRSEKRHRLVGALAGKGECIPLCRESHKLPSNLCTIQHRPCDLRLGLGYLSL